MTDARRMLAAADVSFSGRRYWDIGDDTACCFGGRWFLNSHRVSGEVARLILAGLVLVPVLRTEREALYRFRAPCPVLVEDGGEFVEVNACEECTFPDCRKELEE